MLRNTILSLILALGLGLPALAQTPAEKELQAPLVLDDGKPTQEVAAPPSALRAFVSMALVLGAVGGGLWALRKYGPKRLGATGPARRLKVEETLPLGDRRFVSIIRADQEEFLVAVHPQGITLLSRLDGTTQDFDAALAQEVDLSGGPIAVRDMERMIREGRP